MGVDIAESTPPIVLIIVPELGSALITGNHAIRRAGMLPAAIFHYRQPSARGLFHATPGRHAGRHQPLVGNGY